MPSPRWPNPKLLDDLATVLDSRVTHGLVGIEGTPFAGKSTLAARLAAELHAPVVAEHTDFDSTARDLALAPWPHDSLGSASRQAYFYAVERRRVTDALGQLRTSPVVLMDRTILSILAYSFARTTLSSSSAHHFAHDLDIMRGDAGLCFPARLYLLQVPIQVLLERAKNLESMGNRRSIEPFLLEPSTLELIKWFYTEITSRMVHCQVIGSTFPPERVRMS